MDEYEWRVEHWRKGTRKEKGSWGMWDRLVGSRRRAVKVRDGWEKAYPKSRYRIRKWAPVPGTEEE